MLELILAAIQAILQVIVIVILGVILTRLGYFDNSKQKWLSRLNMNFFTPCLLFINIASVISLEKLAELWPIPFFFFLYVTISWTISQISVRVFGIRGSYRRFIIACSVFCNTNSLPIAILSSLAFSEAGRLLYWNSNDTQQDVAARGISYCLFFAMFGNIIRWSYGYNLLQPKEEDKIINIIHSKDDEENINKNYDYKPTLRHSSYSSTASTIPSSPIHQLSDDDDDSADNIKIKNNNDFDSIPSKLEPPIIINERSPLLSSSSASGILPTAYSNQPSIHPLSNSIKYRTKNVIFKIHSFMSPPLYAALLALIVGLSPLKPLMFNKDSFLYPSFTKAIQSCGKVAVPLILVCLGSQLTFIAQQQYQQYFAFDSNDSLFQSLWLSIKKQKVVFISLFTRLSIIPFIIGTVIVWLKWTNIALLQDPMFVVSIILLGCTPTAINLTQITQVSGVFEEEMMQVLFWSYGVVCIPVMTFIVFISLNIVEYCM
ncbi:auxin efflux carrier [Cunninghamella echinulata]|nr:auxin efflux carrier [Cunninghamella echinulata]